MDEEISLPDVENVPPSIEFENGDDRAFLVAVRIAELVQGQWAPYEAWYRKWNKICIPPWGEDRIKYKLNQGWNAVYGTDLEAPPRERVNKKKLALRDVARIAKGARGLFDQLVAKGRETPLPPLEEIIDRIYPGNPWLCRAAVHQSYFGTGRREDLRGIEKEWEWIVPSPMSKRTGLAATTGKLNSHRCIGNAGPMKYIVIEFDLDSRFETLITKWTVEGISVRDVQSALIRHLATTGEPRAWPFMIVDSGGKSLHSWFQVNRNLPESAALALLARAIPLGADHHADQTEHLFRFPGGTRKSEKSQPQPIIYYDPSKLI